MKTFLLVVFICCCGVFVADAQDLDSLFGVFYLQNTDDAKTEKANEIFKTLKSLDYFSEDVECKKADNFMYGNVYYWHGEVAFEENNFKTASKLGQKALLYIEKIGDLFMLSDCLNLVAISEFSLGNYQKAIDFFNWISRNKQRQRFWHSGYSEKRLTPLEHIPRTVDKKIAVRAYVNIIIPYIFKLVNNIVRIDHRQKIFIIRIGDIFDSITRNVHHIKNSRII